MNVFFSFINISVSLSLPSTLILTQKQIIYKTISLI